MRKQEQHKIMIFLALLFMVCPAYAEVDTHASINSIQKNASKENESGTKLVIGQIKQMTVQMIHYAILAGITKALCEENEISTDILNKLITRRSTVYINEMTTEEEFIEEIREY